MSLPATCEANSAKPLDSMIEWPSDKCLAEELAIVSEEEIRKQKEEQEILSALSQISGQMARVEKLSNHYEKAYGFLTDPMKEQWSQLLAISLTMGKRGEESKNE